MHACGAWAGPDNKPGPLGQLGQPRKFSDALSREVELPGVPQRIVSLVPSLTELLFELGCGARVVGVSDYCVHPQAALLQVARVGGQKDPDLGRLLALGPKLVIVAKEENLRRDVERLEAAAVPVYVTDVRTLPQALALPDELGALCGAAPAAVAELAQRMRAGVTAAGEAAAARARRVRALIAVWQKPWIVAGPDTYMHAVLSALAIENAAAELDRRQRYPKLTTEEIRALAVDLVLLPSEPYPFTAEHLPEITRELATPARLCDGTVACWYGPRTARIGELLARLD